MQATFRCTHRPSNSSILVDHAILLTIYQLRGFVDRVDLPKPGKFPAEAVRRALAITILLAFLLLSVLMPTP